MRYASVASAIAILAAVLTPPAPANAAPAGDSEFLTRAAVMEWIDGYRNKPEPSRVPDAVRALSASGALREPETAGFYVGFVAGVLGANPKDAERLVGEDAAAAAGRPMAGGARHRLFRAAGVEEPARAHRGTSCRRGAA